MINKDYFKQTRILDGGMGQELLARGMKPNSTLWSANAILDTNYHQLVLDTHLDFIKAGAEIIVTTTFATRQKRLKENNLLDKFEYLNQKAGEIAQAAKKKFPNTLIAGGIPPQNSTYEADDRDKAEIIENFNSQGKALNEYVDFYYFDVWSSIKEVECGIEAIKEFKKPVFGICLGHQILSLIYNAKTEKMHHGHRGANHPIKNINSNKVEITVQNHGFVVSKKQFPKNLKITHTSLFDQTIAGIEVKNKPFYSVQYHPESSPGPHDSRYLFDKFIDNIKNQ